MSPPWSRSLEIDRLADGGADIDFAVPLAELSGLHSLRAGVSGNVSGRAHFLRERGLAVAELTLKGVAQLQCQRCMQPLQLPLDARARVALVAAEEDIGKVPEDLEPMLAPDGRLSIGELVAEELLLTLPLVPLHGAGEACGAQVPPAEDEVPQGETHQPFARLAELMKR
jgi:uncharacterized protein